jgi:hypothetical protein
MMISSSLDPVILRKANATFDSQVVSGGPLDTPVWRYVKNLTQASEYRVVQVAVLCKEKKD